MSATTALFAAFALIPAVTGPLPASGNSLIQIGLCQGGTISIPLDRLPTGPATQPCCAKGCQSSERKRIDRKQ